jgi:hypothetical protein
LDEARSEKIGAEGPGKLAANEISKYRKKGLEEPFI